MQKIFGFGIGGSGIVATLIVAGILLKAFNVAPDAGSMAISGGVVVGIGLGILGVLGVAKRVF